MGQDERGYLTIPHELATGADCDGCLVVEEHGDMADLVCNSCGAVVDTVPIDRVGPRLMELASVDICSARCPHCGGVNTFPGYTVVEAFVCRECGEGVSVERPVQ
jgi:NAD-dependent SIR2 family protein deacetylase